MLTNSSTARRARMTRPIALAPLVGALGVAFAISSASAADFTISNASSAAQTLGNNQTGTVTATGVLTIGGGTVAVTINGNNATLNNLGTIDQTGTGRAIRDNTGVANLVIDNGSTTNATALIRTADADVIQMNQANASVTLNNYGGMVSANASAGGSQAVDLAAITNGANVVNNFATGLLKATDADAVRTGVNGVVYNAGRIVSITTIGGNSDGVDMQNNAGAHVTNDTTGLIEGARHGITGGALNAGVNFAATITNNAGGRIQGDNGAGLNFDGFNARQVITVNNAGTILGNGVSGDGDGVDVDGLVNITNAGVIRSANAFAPAASGLAFSEGVSAGGGTITNSGTIEGLVAAGNANAVGRGITLVGNDITSGPLAGTREAIYGNALVHNDAGGLIRGQNDSAIVVGGPASGFTVAIDNAANATIRGGGATTAAIMTGFDDDTITNGGTIDGSSSGRAIDMGAGNNRLDIVGGHAFVLGDVNGGTGGTNTLSIDLGAGNQFSYAGAFSNFANVAIASGKTVLSGANTDVGTTRIAQGATLVLDGASRLAAASTLELAGGTLDLIDVASPNAQTFASLWLDASSTIDLGGSSLTFDALGAVAHDALLAVTGFGGSPSDYALRFVGDLRTDAAFLDLLDGLTINGRTAFARFDGAFTDLVVPEPPGVALMLLGLALVGLTVRRRR